MEEWLVETVMALYEGAEMAIRTANEITDQFKYWQAYIRISAQPTVVYYSNGSYMQRNKWRIAIGITLY